MNSLPQVGPSRLRFVLSVAHKENSDLDLRRRPSTAEYLGLAPSEVAQVLYSGAMGLLLLGVTMYWEDRGSWEG